MPKRKGIWRFVVFEKDPDTGSRTVYDITDLYNVKLTRNGSFPAGIRRAIEECLDNHRDFNFEFVDEQKPTERKTICTGGCYEGDECPYYRSGAGRCPNVEKLEAAEAQAGIA